jgi:outer membrane protein assembly factor BamB
LAQQPIVVGGLVVCGTSADDCVVALDLDTGQPRWKFFTDGPVRFAPAAWRDRLFAASDDGWLYALAWADGRLLWKRRGGPDDRKLLGNERMISRWPARGGPVVSDGVVYFAAGIWPSDGVFLHAVDAQTGTVRWTDDRSGGIYMPQPHGGAEAHSGVAPQGYLAANREQLFVPTGRAVPAGFRSADGELQYYHLQRNHSVGGARVVLTDRFFASGGCLFAQAAGDTVARCGRGVLTATPTGLVQVSDRRLVSYRWSDLQGRNREGKPVAYRGLTKEAEVVLADRPDPPPLAEALRQYPAFRGLYELEPRFAAVSDRTFLDATLEVGLQQRRPELAALGVRTEPFLAGNSEKLGEAIVCGQEVVCGGEGLVRVVHLPAQKVRWSHVVEGTALGLAAAGGRLIVSTTAGRIYCFGATGGTSQRPASTAEATGPQAGGRAESREVAAASQQASAPASTVDYAAAAEEILRRTGVTEGWCLDLGAESGQLALELAKRSRLHICGVEADADRVAAARRRLAAAGLYGVRVSVFQGGPQQAPFPKYCANLIVSARGLGGQAPPPREVLQQWQRPLGGATCLGTVGALQVERRGPLAGAGEWTHLNANPANTLCSGDRLVKGPLEMAWFRDVDFEITDRHAQGPAPLMRHGVLVVEGVDGLCAVDAYNGRLLWTFRVPGILKDQDGVHHDVGVGDTGSNFCLGDDSVYVATGRRCLRLDLQTGRRRGEFETPVPAGDKNQAWGYLAYHAGRLYGSVLNDEHVASPRYANIRLRTESVRLFAADTRTGQLAWQYQPRHSIRNNAIALAGDRVYLVDRPLAPADRITDPRPPGKTRPTLKLGEHPGGILLALDAATGREVWRQDEGIFGTQLAVSPAHDVLLLYYQAVRFDFFRLPSEIGGRMAAFDARTGGRLWDRAVAHKTRPVIIGDRLYADGGAWNLLTGEPIPFQFKRAHGCGQISAGARLLLFRSATLGYLDLGRDAGTENWGGMRPGCWINAIPAGGLVLVPDGSAKCACSYQMHAWLALQPRD